MKKILLGLGTVVAVAAPVATVVACGSEDSINITFPKVKGDYNINIIATIDDTKDGLKNLFKEINKQTVEQMPKEMQDIQKEAIELMNKAASGSIKTASEALKLSGKMVQDSINMAWKYANLNENMTLEFTEPHTNKVTTGKSSFKNDGTEGIEQIEGLKKLTKDNIQDVSDQINHLDREAATQGYVRTMNGLKENAAVKAWAESFPDYLDPKTHQIDWNKCVVLELGNKKITLGTSWEAASDLFSKYIMENSGISNTF